MELLDYVSLYTSASTIIVAVLAIVVTLQTPDQMNKYKLYWITIFIFFGVTSIGAIICQQNLTAQKELARTNNETEKEERATSRENTMLQNEAFLKGQLSSLTLVVSKQSPNDLAYKLSNSFENFAKKSDKTNILPAPLSLKKRALLLSSQILTFYANREAGSPSFSNNMATRDQELKNYNLYFAETIRIFRDTYSQQLVLIHDEFEKLGLNNHDFDDLYKLNVNTLGINMIGVALSELAQKLP